MAIALVPLLFCISIYSLISWSSGIIEPDASDLKSLKNVNNIFFEDFFNILIITDVFLLLFSFFHTDHFHKVIRNSGFIISTILIRISFTVEGITNNLLIVSAVIFGLCVILIHNKFEKHSGFDESPSGKELED
jgi:NADH:ubiquinone oxidoreductase subunit 4 (subunit M)